ncbi:hypothetical protein [Psychrobacter sp. UBA3962]|uniref:hypothetical protein n=1 Tax=Psychrobacter sp. UBA3962 TaxID=1947352 RepID=UPI0025FC5C22|nr:hypothetical protein [Psychrobacter sp. UBA3962]
MCSDKPSAQFSTKGVDVNSLSISKQDNALNDSDKLKRVQDNLKKQIISEIQPLLQISDIAPAGYIVELGSNQEASYHLQQSRKVLEDQAIEAYWSTEFINPDYTATAENPKPDYTNQCGYLKLNQADQPCLTLGELVKASKVIEKQIQQDCYEAEKINRLEVDELLQSITEPKNRVVIIDIDILAIVTDSGEVIAVEERYPFKNHEWVGLIELYQNHWLS